jgi:myosin heavy subunit
MPVHVFSLAEQAYRTMRRAQLSRGSCGNRKQIAILSGQSGAGKVVILASLTLKVFRATFSVLMHTCFPLHPQQTFSANLLVNYLAEPRGAAGAGTEKVAELARNIIAAGPLLEAFGNATTTNNSNSSRFGKYIQLLFDSSGTLCGASLQVGLPKKGVPALGRVSLPHN